MTPEEQARSEIDRQLVEYGWHVQYHAAMNFSATVGMAVRDFPLEIGFADYLLFNYLDGKAVRVIEAAPEGRTLTAVERNRPSAIPNKRHDPPTTAFSPPPKLHLVRTAMRAAITLAWLNDHKHNTAFFIQGFHVLDSLNNTDRTTTIPKVSPTWLTRSRLFDITSDEVKL